MHIHLHKIATFARASLLLTRPVTELSDPLASRGDADMVMTISQTRILPELEVIMSASDASAVKLIEGTRRAVVRGVLDVLCLGGARVVHQVGDLLVAWWEDAGPMGWKGVLEKEILETVSCLIQVLVASCMREINILGSACRSAPVTGRLLYD